MARLFSQPAEIIGGSDQPSAKEMMPDSVDDHSCDQRVVGSDDVLCILQSSQAVLGVGGVVDGLEEAAWYGIAGFLVVPSHEERLVERLIVENARSESWRGNLGFHATVIGYEFCHCREFLQRDREQPLPYEVAKHSRLGVGDLSISPCADGLVRCLGVSLG